MSFFEKMKNKISQVSDNVSDKVATSSLGLTKLIKEIKGFGKDIEKFSIDNQKYVEYLKTSEDFDTVPFSEDLENIDTKRKELIESLSTDCVVPLEELVNDWLELQDMKKEVEKTNREHEKNKKSKERAEAKLEKLQNAEEIVEEKMAAHEEKIAAQEEVVNEIATKVGESFDLVKSKEEGLEKVEKKYKTKETKVMKDVLKSHKDLLAKFHQNSVDILNSMATPKPKPKKATKKTTKKKTTKKKTTKKTTKSK